MGMAKDISVGGMFIVTQQPLTTALVHGDLWLGNVLWDTDAPGVSGVIDWDASHRGIPAVEMMSLVCTTRALVHRIELGAVVRELLASENWTAAELQLISSSPGGEDLEPRTLLLLWWCQHVHSNLQKSVAFERNSVWVAHNIHRVLEVL